MNTRRNGTRPYSPTLDRIGKSSKQESRVVSWEVVEAAIVWGLVVAVNDARGAVLFGATKDRGAWAVTIFHDGLPGKRHTDYCNSEDMLADWLRGLTEMWNDVASELNGSEDT